MKIFDIFLKVIIWFLFVMALFYTARAFCFLPPHIEAQLDQDQREYYIDLIEFHENKADRCLLEAQMIIWYIPESSDKEKAKVCFESVIAGLVASTPTTKIVAILSTMLVEYGLNCMDEYQRINECLNKAKYHADMAEFYTNVLILG